MIEQPAVVSSVGQHQVLVKPGRRSLCDGCKSQGKCNANIFASLFTKRQTELRVRLDTELNVLNVNDEIMIGIRERDFLRLAFVLYGLPIVCLIMVASVLSVLLPLFGIYSEIPVIVVSLISIPLCYRYLSTRHASQLNLAPRFLRKISQKSTYQPANS